ncbi:dihydrolipoyl dehydrogenase [Planctomycetota bacterium]|nr:dihydrolipoyl dehydrogenase [Planctomycetota bacterium]
MPDFDVLVIGAGPGGYVAAIKAAQHGLKAAVVEKEALGGVCLNWGCIPTKALLKSAEVLDTLRHAKDYGLASGGEPTADFAAVMKRSRDVAEAMSKGVAFLMKKNKITVLSGTASFVSADTVAIAKSDGTTSQVSAKHIVIATGHRVRSFPHLPVDGKRVLNYRQLLATTTKPKSLVAIGAGAIGMEFGYFLSTLGTQVTVVEVMDQVLPIEDTEIAQFVQRQFTKAGVAIHTSTKVTKLDVQADQVIVHIEANGQSSTIAAEQVLVAVGFLANTEGLGLDRAGVKLDERGFIAVDENLATNIPGIWAIGDVAGKQLLAHKASHEAEACLAAITGHPQPVDYTQIPGCTYCQPQVASIGLTEKKAKERGRPYKIGKFQFVASGKAKAIGHPEGFVKLVFDAEHMQLIGAHLTGYDATELLGELALAMKLEATATELMTTVHAHPTLHEAVMEAAADALGECVHQ